MITVHENQHSISVDGQAHYLEVESIDIFSERFFLSQFHIVSVDKEV